MRRGAVTLFELLAVLLLFLSVVVGLKYGVRWGSRWGIPGAIGGGLAGIAAGVAFTVATAFLTTSGLWLVGALGQWWRPHPAPCKNGHCTRPEQHRFERLPDEMSKVRPDLSGYGYRCECGGLYASLGGRRWVRIVPDGSIRPYLVHRPFGRWHPDPAKVLPPYRAPRVISDRESFGKLGAVTAVAGVAALLLTSFFPLAGLEMFAGVGILSGGALLLLVGVDFFFGRPRTVESAGAAAQAGRDESSNEGVADHERDLPGWSIPFIMTCLIGGTAVFVILSEKALHDPVSWWLIGGCAAVGLVLGTAGWLGGAWRRNRIALTGRDPVEPLQFVGIKAISLIPGAVAVGVWIAPQAHQSTFDRLVVSLITGGLFLAGFFAGGFSFTQRRPGDSSAVSQHWRTLAALGIAFLILGLALAIIAAGGAPTPLNNPTRSRTPSAMPGRSASPANSAFPVSRALATTFRPALFLRASSPHVCALCLLISPRPTVSLF